MNAQTEIAASLEEKEDLYYSVHKGVRFANMRLLIALGQLDPFDADAVADVLRQLSEIITMGMSHLDHENREVHAALDQRVPGVTEHAAEDHHHHVEAFEELRRMGSELATAEGGERPVRLRRLYQRFALFVAGDFQHMHEEETELQPMIEAHFSASEISGIHQKIVGAIPPEKMVLFSRAMLGGASRPERIGMLTGMQAAMPQEAFPGFMEAVVGKPWRFGEWEELEAALC